MTFLTIAYASTAARDLSAADLEAILAESRRRNEEAGITGALLYCDGNFMQVLEGPPDRVAEAFARICASRRHYQVNELLNQATQEREFMRWTAGCSDADRVEFLDEPPDGRADGPGRALLRGFWRNCRNCRHDGA